VREPLIQWKYRRSPWKLLVACVCLNRTRGTVAKPIIEEIFRRWPTPAALSGADTVELEEVIRPLGLQVGRGRNLRELSRQYNPTKMPREVVESLPGCGPYAADCYMMLVHGDLTVEPEDKELARWRAWALDNPPRWVTRRPPRTIRSDPWAMRVNAVDLSDSLRRFTESFASVNAAAREAIPGLQPWSLTFEPLPPPEEAEPATRTVRFEGGPLHGRVQQLPPGVDHVEVPVEDMPVFGDVSAPLVPWYRTARYYRDGMTVTRGEPAVEVFTFSG